MSAYMHHQLNHVTLNKGLFMGNIFRFFYSPILFHPIFLHAQKPYDEKWKKIDSLMKGKGLTRDRIL